MSTLLTASKLYSVIDMIFYTFYLKIFVPLPFCPPNYATRHKMFLQRNKKSKYNNVFDNFTSKNFLENWKI
jgi:hypothetical protein